MADRGGSQTAEAQLRREAGEGALSGEAASQGIPPPEEELADRFGLAGEEAGQRSASIGLRTFICPIPPLSRLCSRGQATLPG